MNPNHEENVDECLSDKDGNHLLKAGRGKTLQMQNDMYKISTIRLDSLSHSPGQVDPTSAKPLISNIVQVPSWLRVSLETVGPHAANYSSRR